MKSPLKPPSNPARKGNSKYGPDAKYVVHFRDEGQDFLYFVLSSQGVILRSEPFQQRIWGSRLVINMRELLIWRENDVRCPNTYTNPHVRIRDGINIKYPVIRVEIL